MNVISPNEEQARRYLVYYECLTRQKRAGRDRAAEVAHAYLAHLSPGLAASLRTEFNFTWEPELCSSPPSAP